jgi:hypothetical protein
MFGAVREKAAEDSVQRTASSKPFSGSSEGAPMGSVSGVAIGARKI